MSRKGKIKKMIRKAFKMSVKKDAYEEYKYRHDELWPEMAEMLREHGASNYTIFLDEETGFLFGYVEVLDQDMWNKIPETEICKKWWKYMKDIMPSNPDNSPISIELREVFHLA